MNTIMRINALGNLLKSFSQIDSIERLDDSDLPLSLRTSLMETDKELLNEIDNLPKAINVLEIDQLNEDGLYLIEYLRSKNKKDGPSQQPEPDTKPKTFLPEQSLVEKLNYLGVALRQVEEYDRSYPEGSGPKGPFSKELEIATRALRATLIVERSELPSHISKSTIDKLNEDGRHYVSTLGIYSSYLRDRNKNRNNGYPISKG